MELGLGFTGILPYALYLFAILSILLTFYKIELGIYSIIFFIPLENILRKIHIFYMGKDYIDILIIVVILKWIINKKKAEQPLFEKNKYSNLVIIFIAWTFLGLWYGSLNFDLPYPISFSEVRLQAWKNFIIGPILFLIVMNNIRDEKSVTIILLLMALSIIYVGNYFYRDSYYIRSAEQFSYNLKTVAGTFIYLNTNDLGAFFAQYGLLFTVLFFYTGFSFRHVLYGLVIIYSLYGIIYSYSRGAWMASLAGLTVLSIIKSRILLFAIMIFLFFWKEILPIPVIERIDMTVSEDGQVEQSANDRLYYLEQGGKVLGSSLNPIIGGGFATLKYLGIASHLDKKQGAADPHNGYLEIVLEQGIIGLFIMLYLLFLSLKIGWILLFSSDKPFPKALGLGFLICVITIIFNNLTGDRWTYLCVSGYYWILLGLVINIQSLINDQKLPVNK